MDYGDESNNEPVSMDMLEDILDGSQSHPNIHRREERYKKRDRVRQKESQWKAALKATRSMGKGLHKVFSTIVKEFFSN